MEPKVLEALRWIVSILDKHNISYRIGGGLAAHIYGSPRAIKDIDITLPGSYFPVILPDIFKYITSGPKHFSDGKWEGEGISLMYNEQVIDISDIDTLQMSSKDGNKWLKTKEEFWQFDPIPTSVEGIRVYIIDPRDLVAYKKHLGGEHQLVDITAIERYIAENKI